MILILSLASMLRETTTNSQTNIAFGPEWRLYQPEIVLLSLDDKSVRDVVAFRQSEPFHDGCWHWVATCRLVNTHIHGISQSTGIVHIIAACRL